MSIQTIPETAAVSGSIRPFVIETVADVILNAAGVVDSVAPAAAG